MGLPEWVSWLQSIISVAAVLTAGGWLVRWLSHYTAKKRELLDLDKEIRSALKDVVETQKELRQSERERYSVRMAAQEAHLASLQTDGVAHQEELAVHKRQLDTVRRLLKTASEIAESRISEIEPEAYSRILKDGLLIAHYLGVTAAELDRAMALDDDSLNKKLPSAPELVARLIFYTSTTLARLTTTMRISIRYGSAVLDEYDREVGDAPLEQVILKVAERIRRGELDESPAEAAERSQTHK